MVDHGPQPWRSAPCLAGLIAWPQGLEAALALCRPALNLLINDLSASGPKDLANRPLPTGAKLALWRLKHARQKDARRNAIEALATWFEAVLRSGPKATALPSIQEKRMTLAKKPMHDSHARGRQEGRRDRLQKLLALRLRAAVDGPVVARLRVASPEQLEQWTQHLPEAPTIKAVFR